MRDANRDRDAEVLARLARFAALERKATDEIGWIALAYSCSRGLAARMIALARKRAVREGETGK